jgi:hypothetical protein
MNTQRLMFIVLLLSWTAGSVVPLRAVLPLLGFVQDRRHEETLRSVFAAVAECRDLGPNSFGSSYCGPQASGIRVIQTLNWRPTATLTPNGSSDRSMKNA